MHYGQNLLDPGSGQKPGCTRKNGQINVVLLLVKNIHVLLTHCQLCYLRADFLFCDTQF